MPGEGGIGGSFEQRGDLVGFSRDVFLGGFEVFAEEFLGEADERLLLVRMYVSCWFDEAVTELYQEKVAFMVELCGCELGCHLLGAMFQVAVVIKRSTPFA